MVLRIKHTPTLLPTNSLYTPMDNTPLHSIGLCPKLGEFVPLISAKYAAPTPHRERGKDSWKNVNVSLIK